MELPVSGFLLKSFSTYDSILLLRLHQIFSTYGPHINGALGTLELLELLSILISSHSLHFLEGYTNTFLREISFHSPSYKFHLKIFTDLWHFWKLICEAKFITYTRKHQYQSVFFNKAASLQPAALIKKTLRRRCF